MRNRIITLSILAIYGALLSLSAQNKELSFRADGTFKIVQFTDTHIRALDKESQVAIDNISSTLQAEKPDLAILTGDIVTDNPAEDGWKMVLDVLEKSGTPFCILNGNHDWEQKIEPRRIAQMVRAISNSVNRVDAKGVLSDMALEIKGQNDGKTKSVIYCMDSHQYSNIEKLDGYAWLDFNQISWYRLNSEKYKACNGGKTLPSLAFFHIPLPEYEQAFNGDNRTGIRMEHECPGAINSGMYASMLEKGDIMGVFTGHDHDNDYLANMNGISLAYGRFSGGKTIYIDMMPGARVITLYEGRKDFSTYIRLIDGRIIDRYSNAINPKRDVSFAVLGDLHFDTLPETDQYYHVRAINKLENNFVWNSGTPAFKGDTLKRLSGVIIAGDIFDKPLPDTHALYKQRYHKGTSDKSVHYDVYPGYGNHDINPYDKDKQKNLSGRKMNLEYMDSVLKAKLKSGEILNLDEKSLCYSWNIDDVHFVQMHTYAGDVTYAKDANSLDWLEKDLAKYAPANTPVVYIQHYGFDKWAIKWWPKDKRERLFDILDKHRLVGFFVGHTHTASIQSYRGYKIYQVNNAWPDQDGNGSFAVARMKGDTFSVSSYRWTDDKGNFEVVAPFQNSCPDYISWMKEVEDDTPLSLMSLPGSHDSGATKGGEFFQTQDITIDRQLNVGIRVFDIRLKADADNCLRVYHGPVSQNVAWNELIAHYVEFLMNNPSETLVISLKCEGGDSEAYSRLLSKSLNDAVVRPFLIESFTSDMKLKECRGKILLIHRDDVGASYCGVRTSNWQDNVTCDVLLRDKQGNETVASVEDVYQHSYAGKAPFKQSVTMDNIRASINRGSADKRWYISYASATALPKDGPAEFAKIVNPAIAHELQGLKGGCGIVFMDFVGSDYTSEAIRRIIEMNNLKK